MDGMCCIYEGTPATCDSSTAFLLHYFSCRESIKIECRTLLKIDSRIQGVSKGVSLLSFA